MTREEKELRQRIRKVFDARNVSELARKTGYPSSTIRRRLKRPELISAVALLRIEQELGGKT